jgi:hypothetical protein
VPKLHASSAHASINACSPQTPQPELAALTAELAALRANLEAADTSIEALEEAKETLQSQVEAAHGNAQRLEVGGWGLCCVSPSLGRSTTTALSCMAMFGIARMEGSYARECSGM